MYIYVYIYIIYSLRKSNNYSLKSAQRKSVIILWEQDHAKQLYLVLKVSCQRTDNLQPGTNYTQNIVSEILQKHQTYNSNTKRCSLCLNEKLEIARYKGRNFLNKRPEIINKCHHRNKFALALYDSKD